MKKLFKTNWALFALIANALTVFSQSLPLDYKIQHSELIVEGKIIARESFEDHGTIMTNHEMIVYKVLKGEYPGRYINLVTQGGSIGDKTLIVSHGTALSPTESGVFFLSKNQQFFFNNPKNNLFRPDYGDEGVLRYNTQGINRIAFTPSSVHNNIEKEIFQYIEQKTGVKRRIVNLTETEANVQEWRKTLPIQIQSSNLCVQYVFKNQTLSFVNGVLTLEVDIYGKALVNAFELYESKFVFEYAQAAFGNNIVTNNNIFVTKGEAVASADYQLLIADDAPNKMSIDVQSQLNPTQLKLFGSSYERICHIRLLVGNVNPNTIISFIPDDLNGISKYYDGGQALPFECVRNLEPFSGSISSLLSPLILDFTPKTATSGTGKILTITGDNFGSDAGEVLFTNAFVGNSTPEYFKTLSGDVLSWTNTEIKVIVSSCGLLPGSSAILGCTVDRFYAGTGKIGVAKRQLDGSLATPILSSTDLNVPWSVYNNSNLSRKTIPILLADRNMHGSVTVTYGPSMGPNDRLAFDRALKAWRCATGVNFTTNSNWSNVGFGNAVIVQKGAITDLNTLANTGVFLTANNCNETGQESAYQASFSLTFNDFYGWTTTTPSASDLFNIENIGLHELGHAHLLNHVNAPNALMHWTTNSVSRALRTPSSEAIEAGNHIMGISTPSRTGPYCLPPMLRLNWSNCNDLLNPTEDSHRESTISIYPNPAQNFIRVAMDENEIANANLKIYDLLGTLVHKQTLVENNNLIDITKLLKGTYIVEIEQKNVFFRSKLIKI